MVPWIPQGPDPGGVGSLETSLQEWSLCLAQIGCWGRHRAWAPSLLPHWLNGLLHACVFTVQRYCWSPCGGGADEKMRGFDLQETGGTQLGISAHWSLTFACVHQTSASCFLLSWPPALPICRAGCCPAPAVPDFSVII